MRFKDEFNNEELAAGLAEKIAQMASGHPVTLMEVCGTHTMAIHRSGIVSLLPPSLRLLSGPGCPVCVTPNEFMDRAIAYAERTDCIITTFGDLFRVPGSRSSLAKAKAAGAAVKYLYSPEEALMVAQQNPHKKVIFLGIGFETTAPAIAATILEARELALGNFFVLSAMKVVPHTLRILVESAELKLDGLLLPGHLSAITGTGIYDFLPREFAIACVISGFEPLDILQAIYMLTVQIVTGRTLLENQYTRIVTTGGNRKAQHIINEVFETCDSTWRGMGMIPQSGLRLKDCFSDFDAEKSIPISIGEPLEDPGCMCGQILRGLKTPLQCPLYRTRCTPENPVGACMVSSEGTCAAYYKYVGKETDVPASPVSPGESAGERS
jgi:hydrogenase expression/formation protein HypD